MSSRAAEHVLTEQALLEALKPARASGRMVALANGLFDILHVGHLRYLESAGEQADLLLVGVNSDASARGLKGPSRPVVPERERAELVAGLRAVDVVLLFDEETVADVLEALRPDVHAKGTDYSALSVPERAIIATWGGRTVITGDPKDHATSDLIRRLSADRRRQG